MSDLAEVAGDLTWGVAPECGENPVCGGLERVYGIDFARSRPRRSLRARGIAEALNASNIDVAQVCTTAAGDRQP